MPKITSYYGIFPILNKNFVSFGSHQWFLQDNLQIRSITEEEIRFIEESSPPSFRHDLSDVKKALVISNIEQGVYEKVRHNIDKEINLVSLSVQVCFNFLASRDPYVAPFCFLISEAFQKKLARIFEFDHWIDSIDQRQKEFRFDKVADVSRVKYLFEQLKTALQLDPSLRVTYTRYCSAMQKSNIEDQIIDLTIAMESLIPIESELSYKFRLYHSLILTNNPHERGKIFSDLGDLYDARSKLVHGKHTNKVQKLIDKIESRKADYFGYARRAIMYRVDYSSQKRESGWATYLNNLTLGHNSIYDLNVNIEDENDEEN